MRRTWPAALLLAVAVPVSGCGHVAETIQRLTASKTPVAQAPIVTVDAPDPSLVSAAVVADAAHSVVKLHSTAPSCQKILEGSGVVIAPNRVMTNAHVVAGAETFTV